MSVVRLICLRLFLATLAGYALAGTAVAQEAAGDDAYHVRALRGGGSRLREIAGEKVLEFPVGVRIVHGDVTITSERGLHYANLRVTRLIGDVKIVQQTMTMWSDEGIYTGYNDEAVLSRNVRIVDEGWDVTCDRATYSRISGDAWLRPEITAMVKNSIAICLRYGWAKPPTRRNNSRFNAGCACVSSWLTKDHQPPP